MGNVLGIINLINEKPFLKELTQHRCMASVPFGGRYRLIDFTLSNFIHASITKVGVFTKEKYRSIMDHLGSGKEWDLDRRNGGLFILPPVHPDEKMKGDLEHFYDHLEFFQRSHEETVIISPGYHVSKMDFNDIMAKHKADQADITVVYKDYHGTSVEKPIYHTCTFDEEETVTDIELYTSPVPGEHVCLETFVISKKLLINLIINCVGNGEYDLIKDAVKANLHTLRVKAYHFTGEMPFIHSVESFHSGNMAFLNPEIIRSNFYDSWDLYTKVKHEAPVNYGLSSKTSNSLIANGCEIEGVVEDSILFRGVKVHPNAIVKNSIIMQRGEIGEGAYLENVIMDKQARITKDTVVMGGFHPKVIKKAEII
ncbi:glucose-1-phosphate adenylyltransferase subunit GlgD [Peribacillus cavernae]|uniref:Glucose-1-phosphate adenylyltransferase subunit GlgD n=1 Tax=Peribacillus cavernae TaxID=1674310 RepID=A0A3S1B9A6_9BACI|nr:glucose-1-phosphate adenylyltransferase subunit GlgD [Peribacillus cavernae]MDQ0218878.1 glucose-1-phosphate adenylyltransferase [Peribacillus cavernae]RUQ31077.1 glucose-1-phosphate adenylyltransferase subunit GlgD [Peribacillus cavernae]